MIKTGRFYLPEIKPVSVCLRALILLILLVAFVAPASAETAKAGRHKQAKTTKSRPVVNAVIFWMVGCSHCERLKEKVLPPLQAKYGDQLKIKLIEAKDKYDEDLLYKVGAEHKMAEEEIGVPFMMYGKEVMVGDKDIEKKFPPIIDKYLASGGLPFPDDPLLKKYLTSPRPVASTPPKSKVREEASVRAGLVMASVIAVIMIASLISAFMAFVFPDAHGNRYLVDSAWPDRILPILFLLGIGVAGYLTKVEFSGGAPFCGVVQGCDKVQSSEYAWIIKGILPVGLLGLVAYVAMQAAWVATRFTMPRITWKLQIAIFFSAAFGLIYSLYLTWIELFVLKAACIWCLISADTLTLILLLSLPAARKARLNLGF